jgi:hypothetical protein
VADKVGRPAFERSAKKPSFHVTSRNALGNGKSDGLAQLDNLHKVFSPEVDNDEHIT